VTTLQWIGLGFGVAFLLSLSVTLALAAVLGSISREISRVLESEAWASAPSLRQEAAPTG
jgi:hypothetical protein